jgi:uncharacterized membrane protein
VLKRLRNYLITGAVVLVPVVLTWYVLLSLFRFLDGMTARWVVVFLGRPVPGLGMLVTIGIVLITGILTRSFLGRELILLGQSILQGTPIVRSVYNTIRQIVDAFAVTDQTAFKRVCLIEYPRKGAYSIAFVTSTSGPAPAAPGAEDAQDLVSVFLPTTPNPTSGFLLYLPRTDITPLDMSVEEGLKLVISGGVITPAAGAHAGVQAAMRGRAEARGETPRETAAAQRRTRNQPRRRR